MSYILDALKKSEQERGHGNIPDVQTVHSSSLNYRNDKKAWWPYLLIIAVLLNLMAIIYFIIDRDQIRDLTHDQADANTANLPQTSQPMPGDIDIENIAINDKTEKNPQLSDSNIAASKSKTQAVETKGVSATTSRPLSTVNSQAEPKPASQPNIKTSDSNNLNIIEYYDLTESERQLIPTIIVSAHVYSSNPLQRSMVINSSFMEEGDYVLDGLILFEITPDGAIFNYQGTVFHYGVVSGWQ